MAIGMCPIKKTKPWWLVVWLLLWMGLAPVYAESVQDAQNAADTHYALPSTAQQPSTQPPMGIILGISAVVSAIAAAFAGINPTLSAIAIGGALGSLSRYFVSSQVGAWHGGDFPYGTMAVNIVGSFLFGVVGGVAARNDHIADTAWLDLMTTGFLGGFTTFSTFANDTVRLSHEEGMLTAAAYTGVSVGISVFSVLAGEMVGLRVLP